MLIEWHNKCKLKLRIHLIRQQVVDDNAAQKRRRTMLKKITATGMMLLASLLITSFASAVPYNYTDWTAANVNGGTASGIITLPDFSTVTVNLNAVYVSGAPGNFAFAQVNGGTNYWNPSTPFISSQVDNAPPGTDIIALSGGQNQIYRVTLSEAIKDPIMSIVSLGQPGSNTTYDFNAPFTIVSQGVGYWGGSPTALAQLPGDILQGNEGHGTIQFLGTFSTFEWTVPTPEYWHGFTFGIRTTEAIEPSNPVPEPSTIILFGAGLAGFGFLRRRMKK